MVSCHPGASGVWYAWRAARPPATTRLVAALATCTPGAAWATGRCFRVVDCMLDEPPELIPVDKQSDDQVVHPLGLRKADRPAHQPLDPRPQVDVFALDFLGVLFADCMLRGVNMPEGVSELWICYAIWTSLRNTIELFLNKIKRGSKAQHRCQRHHPQSPLCDCGRHAPKCCSVSCRQWHAQ